MKTINYMSSVHDTMLICRAVRIVACLNIKLIASILSPLLRMWDMHGKYCLHKLDRVALTPNLKVVNLCVAIATHVHA